MTKPSTAEQIRNEAAEILGFKTFYNFIAEYAILYNIQEEHRFDVVKRIADFLSKCDERFASQSKPESSWTSIQQPPTGEKNSRLVLVRRESDEILMGRYTGKNWIVYFNDTRGVQSSDTFYELKHDKIIDWQELPLTPQKLDLTSPQPKQEPSLYELCGQAIANYPDKAKDYHHGKVGMLGLFMGEVMKLSKGKADPKEATALLKQILDFPSHPKMSAEEKALELYPVRDMSKISDGTCYNESLKTAFLKGWEYLRLNSQGWISVKDDPERGRRVIVSHSTHGRQFRHFHGRTEEWVKITEYWMYDDFLPSPPNT